MADYWKSQGRKFCDFCKCWIADNKPSIEFHEGGKKHKENVSKRLKEIHKNSAKQAKQNKKFEDDLKKMENAAMAAYLKDVENNTRDMTAERIIKEKLHKTTEPTNQQHASNPNHPGSGLLPHETGPRFKSRNYQRTEGSYQYGQEIDPCDPMPRVAPPPRPKPPAAPSENKNQGKGKSGKGKGKGKKVHEEKRPGPPVSKLWYEAVTPEGYTYYWHIETNDSVWDPPEEGYMTLAEQEEEAKEHAVQQELLEQLAKEELVEKADIFEERRANAEREKLKELRERAAKRKTEQPDAAGESEEAEDEEKPDEKQEIPYRRDYSIPERIHPYGPWQTVRKIEKKPVDLQLPRQSKPIQPLPTFQPSEPPPPPQRTFKEKIVTQIATGDSDDDDGKCTMFKRRKISNKNVRKRLTDD